VMTMSLRAAGEAIPRLLRTPRGIAASLRSSQ
jgi:hypothetical protein